MASANAISAIDASPPGAYLAADRPARALIFASAWTCPGHCSRRNVVCTTWTAHHSKRIEAPAVTGGGRCYAGVMQAARRVQRAGAAPPGPRAASPARADRACEEILMQI